MQPRLRYGMANRDQAALPQIGNQDPHDAERQVEIRGEIGNRDGDTTQPQDREVFGIERPAVGRWAPR